MEKKQECVNIGTVSGGIVNFGGAVYIAPISVTKSISGSGEDESISSSQRSVTSLIDFIRRSIE
ncbi:hypothetical protein QE429_002737 [Bacillus sp. SORGH_AS 510]|uniref:spore germination protein n=1 Tax=Bacillus sp. SORGH_AS_0510 TaxID=3041771 RepID=UPI00277EAC31|nr:spore germination protein [Bacillus sp. SORGH_AS_0510]MDQ1145910.1 hypothetical protein [Bacillus sp. SORGH_AS_0510]